MIRDWSVLCKDCLKPFYYSDQAAREAEQRGESRPERCPACRAEHNKATSRMGAAYLDLDPGDRPVAAGALKAGRLGRLDRGPRPHEGKESPHLAVPDGEFGITDDHVRELLGLLEEHKVVVVEAPTGSGKSTFLPWRLLAPPEPYVSDHITRHGTIVVTQPRIEATQGIPRFIATTLHGARVGAGLDIGFRHSKARDRADSRNRLVYATDGTLLNMIRRGELHECSVIVLDEAHERSLNIDLILALLRRELVALPHLRLLVVSATINAASFTGFFRPELLTTAIPMPGKDGKPVFERWRAGPPVPASQMAGEVARTAHEVLRWMACGECPPDIPASIPAYDGDILAFLPGKRSIAAAIDELTDLIDEDEDLAGEVEVLPLYAELPQRLRTRALERPEGKTKTARWRVVIATNIAETSLTIKGIRHVVDSGLINSTEWDTSTLTTVIRPGPHSKSGLLQRRGRAGRTDPGIWHCLFTREQFDQLPADTPPEITRAPLEGVVLAAAAAGVSDPASLRWMPPGPPPDELRRAMAVLRGMGAVTTAGDPTSLGTELAASRESFSAASLLMCADEAGVAVEAATMLAAVSERRWVSMLQWGRWPASARLAADRLHTALLSECADDLDAVLLLVGIWERLDGSEREGFATRRALSAQVLQAIVTEREKLLQSLQSRTRTARVRAADPGLADRLRRVIAWSSPNSIYRLAGAGEWVPELVARSDPEVVRRLHEGARPVLDSDCLLTRRESQPPFLFALVRDRRRRWVSPLQDPVDQVTLSCCVALRPEHLAGDVPLLAHTAGHRAGEGPGVPVVLPGERLIVEAVGTRSSGVQVRVLSMSTPMPVAEIEVDASADPGEESGDLAQREVSEADKPAGLDEETPGAAQYLPSAEPDVLPARARDRGAAAPDQAVVRNAIASLEIIASRFDPAQPVVVVRSVMGGLVQADPDPVSTAQVFAEQYRLGDECAVRVIDVRTLQRDRRRIALAREEGTGAEILLTGYDLGFGVRDSWLEELAPGTRVRLAVAGVDTALGLVQLTALPWTAATLSRLAEPGAEPFSGVIVDARDDSVHVLLSPDGTRLRPDDPPITVEIRADYLPPRPTEMAIGQEVRVRLSPRRRTSATADLGIPHFRFPDGPFEQRGGSLSVSGQMTARDVLAMYRVARGLSVAEALMLHRSLGQLTARALRPRGRIIDVTGLVRLRKGQRVPGTVVATTERGVVVQVTGGTRSAIPGEYLAWPGQPPPRIAVGDEISVHVTEVEPDKGRLLLSVRDPALDPFARLEPGNLLYGQVRRSDGSGVTAWAANPGVEVFIPGRESGFPANQLETALPPGAQVNFRLIEVDPARRRVIGSRWLRESRYPLPADILAMIQGNRKSDPRRLRSVLGGDVDLRVDDDTLVLRWTDEPEHAIRSCLDRLAGLTGGLRAQVAIPHPGPLDIDARDRISAESGCLLRLERAQGTRVTWSVAVVFPRHVSIEEIRRRIAEPYPALVRGTLRTAGVGQFPALLQSFRAAERARKDAGQPSSQLWLEKPYNYVELGSGDSYEEFSQRLLAGGLFLNERQWAHDYRIFVASPPRPVMPRPVM